MNWNRIVLTGLAVCLFAGGIAGLVWLGNWYQDGKDVAALQFYSGREYFTSEEYEGFKQFLADYDEIRIKSLEVLSSETPLVVFEVYAPGGIEFPYGVLKWTDYKADLFGLALGIVACVFIGGFLGTACLSCRPSRKE